MSWMDRALCACAPNLKHRLAHLLYKGQLWGAFTSTPTFPLVPERKLPLLPGNFRLLPFPSSGTTHRPHKGSVRFSRHSFIHPSIHAFISSTIHPCIHPSISIIYHLHLPAIFINLHTHPSIHPSIYISCHLSVHNYELPSMHSSTSMTYPSIYLYHLFIHPFTQQPTHSPTYIFCHLPTYLSTFPASQPLYLLSAIYVSSTIINPYLCVCVSMYPTISSELISKNEHLCGAHILTYWSVSLLN